MAFEGASPPALRKGSAFPAHQTHSLLLRAAWKAMPSRRRGGGSLVDSRNGKAQPFRTASGAAARRSSATGA